MVTKAEVVNAVEGRRLSLLKQWKQENPHELCALLIDDESCYADETPPLIFQCIGANFKSGFLWCWRELCESGVDLTTVYAHHASVQIPLLHWLLSDFNADPEMSWRTTAVRSWLRRGLPATLHILDEHGGAVEGTSGLECAMSGNNFTEFQMMLKTIRRSKWDTWKTKLEATLPNVGGDEQDIERYRQALLDHEKQLLASSVSSGKRKRSQRL